MPPRQPQNPLWERAFPALVAIALRWTYRNEADAEDLAQQALLDAFAASPEPPAELRELVARAASIMKGHLLNRRKAEKRREDPRWLPVAAKVSSGLRRTPEDLAATRQDATRMLGALQADLADDPTALEIVEATLDGYDTAADQAEHLNRDIADIRNARKRVHRARDAIAAREEEALRARDWGAGEGASLREDARDATEPGEEGESAEE